MSKKVVVLFTYNRLHGIILVYLEVVSLKNKLYNVYFPIWLLILIPAVWLITVPVNFIIDSIVLFVTVKLMNIEENVYKKSIIKVFLFGFVSDLVGSLLLLLTQFIPNDIVGAISWNPFSNVYALLYVLFSIVISGICIYFLDYKIAFKKLNITLKEKRKIALVIAVITAPYFFLYPTSAWYSEKSYIAETNEPIGQFENFVKIDKGTSITDNNLTSIFSFSTRFTKYSIYSEEIRNLLYNVDINTKAFNVNLTLSENIHINEEKEQEEVYNWLEERAIITFGLTTDIDIRLIKRI